MTTLLTDAAVAQDVRGNELVLRCLRREPQEKKVAALEKLTAAEWHALVKAAARYRLGPLIFRTIKPCISQLTIPEELCKKLRNIYFQSAAHNVRLYSQVLKNISMFKKAGVEVILLKGAHLAEFVYENPALRPMSDVDLLVRRMDLRRIDNILKDMGYVSAEQSLGSSLTHLPPYTKKGHVTIEVHLNITSPPISERFNPDDLWIRAEKKNIQGVDVMTLSREDLFLHLCEHAGIHHAFENGLIPYVDIVYIVEKFNREIDWPGLLNRAKLWGMERCLCLMLALTEKKLGLTISEAAKMEMSKYDMEMKDALAIAEKLILERRSFVSPGIARLFEKGWRSKLKHFRERAFPAQEYMGQMGSLSHWDLWKRYRFRLEGIWQRHAATVWSAVRRDPVTLAALELRKQSNALGDWLKK